MMMQAVGPNGYSCVLNTVLAAKLEVRTLSLSLSLSPLLSLSLSLSSLSLSLSLVRLSLCAHLGHPFVRLSQCAHLVHPLVRLSQCAHLGHPLVRLSQCAHLGHPLVRLLPQRFVLIVISINLVHHKERGYVSLSLSVRLSSVSVCNAQRPLRQRDVYGTALHKTDDDWCRGHVTITHTSGQGQWSGNWGGGAKWGGRANWGGRRERSVG